LNKKSRINAKIFAKKLLRRNIETRPFFYPMNKQKILKELKLVKNNEKFPNSEYISEYGLYLPSGINLKYNEIKYICDEVNNILS
jgi:perosamine synthetase